MRRKILLVLFLALVAFAADAHAMLVPIDFEGLPLTYYRKFGNQNLGTYYPGLSFGPHVTILDKVIGGYNDYVYPPVSGDAVFYDEDGPADIIFDNPTTYFEGWFSHMNGFGLYIYAYDPSDNLVDTAYMPFIAETLPWPFVMKLTLSAPSIKRVHIAGSPNCWTGDSIGYESTVIPEPVSILLFGAGIFGLGAVKKRRHKSI